MLLFARCPKDRNIGPGLLLTGEMVGLFADEKVRGVQCLGQRLDCYQRRKVSNYFAF
jgi:hypothetical protein